MSYVPVTEPLPHEIGFLTINENGAILASGGDLENDEARAEVIYKLVTMQPKVDSFLEDVCTRLSVNFSDHAYVICLSNKKIHVVKRKVYSAEEDEPYVVDTNVPITNSINT